MTLGDVGVVISCVGHLHSNSWRANLFEVRPLIINSFFSLHFKAALMLFEVRSLLEVLGYAYQLPGQPCLVTSGLLLLDSHYVTRAIAIASSYKNLQGETILILVTVLRNCCYLTIYLS